MKDDKAVFDLFLVDDKCHCDDPLRITAAKVLDLLYMRKLCMDIICIILFLAIYLDAVISDLFRH
ncbi:hypothetical protein NDN01_04995 [Sphingomonas sp. QA11]|uniref:hypothetical protein n=1 Tax=Sphingomonas sp. QA11 TaxID=2950605 RepID=UPI0023493056|nr:hypothetical protein [Sphingomonas sp. QA11]WCM28283.1 hypothetical protein NDN01_04995 [Sphingomonas sp. QA11]